MLHQMSFISMETSKKEWNRNAPLRLKAPLWDGRRKLHVVSVQPESVEEQEVTKTTEGEENMWFSVMALWDSYSGIFN